MNKRQIEVQKLTIEEEAKVIGQLKQVYTQAKKDCEAKISTLASRRDLENIQSIVYQKQYQQALKKQIDGVLDTLQNNEFTTISDYVGTSYENGFFGTLYDLQGQGIPLCFPIDQAQVVQALEIDSKISTSLYKKLGEDTEYLKKSIKAEVSRGIASGLPYAAIAVRIADGMNSPFNKAYNNSIRIARTEGHRVQQSAALDCQCKAKEKGADVKKQWDATLDSVTRPHHKDLDGQIREVEESFEVAGLEAMHPGAFGTASEDCNCRCCVLPYTEWKVPEAEFTKMNGDTNELVKIKAKDYNKFKETAKIINQSLEYRIINYNNGDYSIKERVTFLEAITDMPKRVKDSLANSLISFGSEGSAYDPLTDTIYVGKDARKYEIIHEIGHAIENKMFDKDKVNFVKRQCVNGLTFRDIQTVTASDSSGNKREIFILNSGKFTNRYQGRIYDADLKNLLNSDETINTDCLKEFISVAVQEYFNNPMRMKKSNYEIFALIDEVMQ